MVNIILLKRKKSNINLAITITNSKFQISHKIPKFITKYITPMSNKDSNGHFKKSKIKILME